MDVARRRKDARRNFMLVVAMIEEYTLVTTTKLSDELPFARCFCSGGASLAGRALCGRWWLWVFGVCNIRLSTSTFIVPYCTIP